MDFSTIKITSEKVSVNKVDFSTREITSKKVRRSNVDFSKKCVKRRGFFDHRNYIEKVRENDVEIC